MIIVTLMTGVRWLTTSVSIRESSLSRKPRRIVRWDKIHILARQLSNSKKKREGDDSRSVKNVWYLIRARTITFRIRYLLCVLLTLRNSCVYLSRTLKRHLRRQYQSRSRWTTILLIFVGDAVRPEIEGDNRNNNSSSSSSKVATAKSQPRSWYDWNQSVPSSTGRCFARDVDRTTYCNIIIITTIISND